MHQRRWPVVLLALSGGIAAMLTGWFLVYLPLMRWARPPRPVQNELALRQLALRQIEPALRKEVAEAFRPKAEVKVEAPAGDNAESFRVFFDRLGGALRARDRDQLAAHLDTRRMLKEFRRAGLLPGIDAREEEAMHAVFSQSFLQALTRPEQLLQWERTEIRSVKFLADAPDEAVVIARHRNDDVLVRMRWWVRRDGGGWRVYDLEDLDTGIRVSTLVGSMIPPGGKLVAPEWTKAGPWANQVGRALLSGDLDAAQRALDAIAHHRFPPALEGLRWMFLGTIQIARQHPQEGLAHLDKARGFNPDMPMLDQLYGAAYNALGRHDKALDHIKKYSDLLGEDTNTCFHMGVALRGLGRTREAADAFRKSLDENANSLGTLSELRRTLPAGGKAEVTERFARVANPHEHFENLVGLAFGDRDPEGVEALVAVLRRQKTTDPVVDFCEARAKVLAGRPAEGVPLFKKAMAAMPDNQVRKDYVNAFLRDMAEARRAVDAYRAAPAPTVAFSFLAQELLNRRDQEGLRELLEAYRKDHKPDAWLHFYTAEMHVNAGAYDRAEAEFASAMTAPPDDQARERFRAQRVAARVLAGKGMSAYADIGPRQATFVQLAELFSQRNDGKQLDTLIAAHRKNEPADPKLPLWEADARWIAKDYAAVAKLLQEHRAAAAADRQHAGKLPYRLIRSLVHLKRDDDVRKEVEALARGGATDRQQMTFLLGDLVAARETEAVDTLAEALRKAAPDDPETFLALARARMLRQQTAEASTLLREALARQKDAGKRQNYVSSFLFDTLDAGRPLEGYRAAPDGVAAFRQLGDAMCEDLMDLERPNGGFRDPQWRKDRPGAAALREGLRQLLEVHRAKHPDDVMLHYFAGELHRFAKDYERAAQAYAAGMARPLDEQLRQRFRFARVSALYKAGKGQAAYADVGPRQETFAQLANRYVFDKDVKGLAALIAAHRKNEPGDRNLPVWETEARWLAGDYAGALKLLNEHRLGAFADNQHKWKFGDRLVRSLIRLKRFDEAGKEAEAIAKEKFGNLLLPAIVYASAGNVAKTGAALEELVKRRYTAHAFYGDADLGTALRSEPFRALRARYPEPQGPARPPDDFDD